MQIDVIELDVADAQRALVEGRVTARQLTQAHLDRIASIDRPSGDSKEGPTLNSVIELNCHALDDAERLDAERVAGKSCGPLRHCHAMVRSGAFRNRASDRLAAGLSIHRSTRHRAPACR